MRSLCTNDLRLIKGLGLKKTTLGKKGGEVALPHSDRQGNSFDLLIKFALA